MGRTWKQILSKGISARIEPATENLQVETSKTRPRAEAKYELREEGQKRGEVDDSVVVKSRMSASDD